MGLSPLKSHKMAHHFQDTPYDTCSCSRGVVESTYHLLLHCPKFIIHRKIIFHTVNPILREFDVPFLADNTYFHMEMKSLHLKT